MSTHTKDANLFSYEKRDHEATIAGSRALLVALRRHHPRIAFGLPRKLGQTK